MTRAVSTTRWTRIAKVAVSSTLSSSFFALKVNEPLIAAAVVGQAVAASGM